MDAFAGRHCLFLLTCMTFKSLSDVINYTLFNKMHGLLVYPSFETFLQLLESQQYRVYMVLQKWFKRIIHT